MTGLKTKKVVIRAAVAFVLLILVVGLYVGISIAEHIRLVDGEPIAKYAHPQKALVVVDVQTDLTSPRGKAPINPSLTDTMIQNINEAIDRAQTQKMMVVYIRHEFKAGFLTGLLTRGALRQGTPGVEIDPRIHMVSDQVFVKNIMDSFSNPEFDLSLRENQVSDLVLTGVDVEACVDAVLKSALQRGYGVTVIRDCVATSSTERRDEKLKEFESLGAKVVAVEEAF